MDKVYVIYWTQSGNTQAMAEAVGKGITDAGKEAVVVPVGTVSVEDLKDAAGFALGCPAMGAEVLEESEMEPFVCEVEAIASGKTIGLFGSYGWGDGQWMRDWCARCESANANLYEEEGLTVNEAPDADAQEVCRQLGRKLAAW